MSLMRVRGEWTRGIGSGEPHTSGVANILETGLSQMGTEMGQQWEGMPRLEEGGVPPTLLLS